MANFEKAVEVMNGLKHVENPPKLSNDQLLELYAFYKQATVGDNNTDRPGMLAFEGKAKWDAWTSKKGLSKDDARSGYVAAVKKALSGRPELIAGI